MNRSDGDVPGGVVLAREVQAARLRRLRSRQEVERVRRGAYLPAGPSLGPARDARRLAMARIAAVHAQLTGEHWFSHESAALLWGCDVVRLSPLTHVIQRARPGSRGRDVLVRHHGGVPVDQRDAVNRFPVTCLARTLVDCASSLPADRALVIADSGLRQGASPEAVAAVLADRPGARGVAQARTVLALADGRAQSPGETLTRWALHEHGIPAPELQLEVVTRRGRYFLDLGWQERRLGLEFDGLVKYSGEYGSTAPEAIFAEKQRQDAIEDEGWRLIRITWQDLNRPAALADRIRQALTRRPHAPLT